MIKTFRCRCSLLEGGKIDPDYRELFNIDDPTEIYLAGSPFQIGRVLREDEFYLEERHFEDSVLLLAFKK